MRRRKAQTGGATTKQVLGKRNQAREETVPAIHFLRRHAVVVERQAREAIPARGVAGGTAAVIAIRETAARPHRGVLAPASLDSFASQPQHTAVQETTQVGSTSTQACNLSEA